jgi:hypothetical protein
MTRTTFRDREKNKYEQLKPILFSPEAQAPGEYKHHFYDFCLANGYSEENIYSSFRQETIEYFKKRGIQWHDGCNDRTLPSNHLCCSQSSCVNFLFPMARDKKLLKRVFSNIYPEFLEALPMIEGDVPDDYPVNFLAFEWIGLEDYLGETKRKPGKRTRGANYTSADFAFRFIRTDGLKQTVLGEWKYTEYYGYEDKGTNKVRLGNYRDAFNRIGGTFKDKSDELYRSFFFEPIYQLMRLQLLAQEMESHKEMGAEVVSVLHVSPQANREFRGRVTSKELSDRYPGIELMDVWKSIVEPGKFLSISVEGMLEIISKENPDDNGWEKYLRTRYSFV